jgi:hypothetical protein
MGKMENRVSIILDVNKLLYADNISLETAREEQADMARAA